MSRIQNKILNKTDLDSKYGDTGVGVIRLTDEYKVALGEGGFLHRDTMVLRVPKDESTGSPLGSLHTPLSLAIAQDVITMKRSDAELDDRFLQPIVYTILCNGNYY